MMPKPKSTVRGLPVYNPGKSIEEVKDAYGLTDIIKLASNENPFGCSPAVLENLLPSPEEMALYPDGAMRELRARLAENLNVREEQLIFGNGSDEIIQHIARCYLESGMNAVMADVTFPRYKTNVQIEGADAIEVPLKHGVHDLDAMAAAVNDKTKVVWVCNPNNPTGTIVTEAEVEAFLQRIPPSTLVVLDEAYCEYVADERYPDSLSLLDKYPNVIVLRTFSKIYGLASLRVGYGIAASGIVSELNRVREPFNVNRLAQRAALAALQDQSFIARCREKNLTGIRQLSAAIERLGMKHFPAHGNFVFIETGLPAAEVFQHLLQQGVIVRTDPSWGFPTAIRVTVGSEQENQTFINALEQFLHKRGKLSVS